MLQTRLDCSVSIYTCGHNKMVDKMLIMMNRLNLKVGYVCGCYIVTGTGIEEIAFQYLKTFV